MIFPKWFLTGIWWSLHFLWNADKLKMPQSRNFPIMMLRPLVYNLQTAFSLLPFWNLVLHLPIICLLALFLSATIFKAQQWLNKFHLQILWAPWGIIFLGWHTNSFRATSYLNIYFLLPIFILLFLTLKIIILDQKEEKKKTIWY